VIDTLESQPSVLQRRPLGEKLLSRLMAFIDTFFSD
jgi:hypothetical protein